MHVLYDKKTHLENAMKLIEASDTASLRYACLELRFALEAHVYERLSKEVDELPRSVVEKWEPNKAMKMLTMFDELADLDVRVTISEQDGSNPHEFTYHNIKNIDLSRLYNKLGSYLHLPQPSKAKDFQIRKDKIKFIADSILELCEGNLIIIKKEYHQFNCTKCEKPILYTYNYITQNNSIICQNENCRIEHMIEHKGENVYFGSKIQATCVKCKSDVNFFYSELKVGNTVLCPNCKYSYMVNPWLCEQD